MKKRITIYIPLLLFFFSMTHCLNVPTLDSRDNYIANFTFDPDTVQAEILRLIDETRESITISLYGFDNQEIANALVDAKIERGIDVRMSTEYDSEGSRSWQTMINRGIPVTIGNPSGIMHNKYLIFDDTFIVTGSTNLTRGMFRHFNNTIIMKSQSIIAEYKQDFMVQEAGYYANKKDAGYDDVIGGGADIDWNPIQSSIGGVKITPFFTPYKKTILQYTASDILKSKKCPSNATDTDIEKACFRRGSNDSCQIVHSKDSCALKLSPDKNIVLDGNEADLDCYNLGAGNATQGLTYRFLNHDKVNPTDEDKPAESCLTYNHALNIVVQTLRSAKKSIKLLVFAFTDRVIMQELIRAKSRGVDIKIWMDSNQYRSSRRHSEKSFINLASKVGHFKVARRSNGGLLHHKVIIVDDDVVILGSMNYSSSAVNSNDENFLLLENAHSIVKRFKEEITNIDKTSVNLLDQPEVQGILRDAGEDPNSQ